MQEFDAGILDGDGTEEDAATVPSYPSCVTFSWWLDRRFMPLNDPSRTYSLSQWSRSPFREIAQWLLDLMLPLPALVGSLSSPISNLFTD